MRIGATNRHADVIVPGYVLQRVGTAGELKYKLRLPRDKRGVFLV
jgi:hypothetical protein